MTRSTSERPTDSLFIVVTVRANDPASSAELANAVASQLVLQAPALLGAAPSAQRAVLPVENALPPTGSSSTRSILYAVMAAAAAIFVGVLLAIALDYRRARRPQLPPPAPAWPDSATRLDVPRVTSTQNPRPEDLTE